MADNNSRSASSRDRTARADLDPAARRTTSDPLAELARLIGQSDPAGDSRRSRNSAPAAGDDVGASGFDWASAETDAQEDGRADHRYVPLPDVSRSGILPQHNQRDEEQPLTPRFFSGSAAKFNGFKEDAAADYGADPHAAAPSLPSRQSDARLPEAFDGYDEADEAAAGDRQDYGEEGYQNEPPQRRRSGLIVVMAVLALAVVGTAGAFGYRAMFGGSVLSALPPIIKASSGPNKIVPGAGEKQASDTDKAGAPNTAPTERLAAPAEQPVDVQQSVTTTPRVISTIPIASGSNQAAPGAPPAAAGPPAMAALAAPAVALAMPASAAAPTAASGPATAAMASQPATATPAAALPPASTEPKKVRTVTIRADQQGARNATGGTRKSATRTAQPKGDQPLSIVPGVPGASSEAPAAPERAQTGGAPMTVASAAPDGGNAAAASSGGGYAVQVTSQRTEAEAKSAYRSLQAKYPGQLGNREPILHRADLGAKGTYYRALVGPFASAEAAAEMCSSLKAAGGSCLVQRN